MKIKEIKKYHITVKNQQETLYTGDCDQAPEEIKNKDIQKLELSKELLLIEV